MHQHYLSKELSDSEDGSESKSKSLGGNRPRTFNRLSEAPSEKTLKTGKLTLPVHSAIPTCVKIWPQKFADLHAPR